MGALPTDDPRVAAGVDRLMQRMNHNELEEEWRRDAGNLVGDDAWPELLKIVAELEYADPGRLTYDHARPDVFDPPLRASMRMLACVIGLADDMIPDEQVPVTLWHLIDNPNLSLHAVQEACAGRGGVEGFVEEVPVPTLRRIAQLLVGDAPPTHRDIVDEYGVSTRVVGRVSNLIRARQVIHNREVEQARRALEDGKSIQQVADENGWGRPRARERLAEAADLEAA